MTGKAPTQRVMKLGKLDNLKAVMSKLCRDEELKWENNPYICRVKQS